MGTPTYPSGLTRAEGETLSLTTALATLGIPSWAEQATIYVPSKDFRLAFNPRIEAVHFFDASESVGSRWKASSGDGPLVDVLQRRSEVFGVAVGTGTLLDSSTTSDFLYIVTSDVVGGFGVVMKSANGTASTTIVCTYRKTDDTWAALTESDGTASGGIALAQSGDITWTAPTDAKRTTIASIDSDSDAPSAVGYIWRIAWDEALDADTEIGSLWTINKGDDRMRRRLGVEYSVSFDKRKIGAIELILAADTDTAEIDWVGHQ